MSKRMTESQIVAILKEAEAGMPVKDLCRKYGIGNSILFYLGSHGTGFLRKARLLVSCLDD